VEIHISYQSSIAAMLKLASATTRDWDSSIQCILQVEASVLQVERASFWELCCPSGGKDSFVCYMTYDRRIGAFERGPTIPVADVSDYLEAVEKHAPLVVEDVRGDARLRGARAYLDARQVTSLLDCPVWCGGELAGVLSAEQLGAPRCWSLSCQSFAVSVAPTVSAALEARARSRAQEHSKRMTFLEQASRTLGGTLDVEEVARRAVALFTPTLVDGARVALFEDEGRLRTVALAYRTPEGQAQLAAALRAPADVLHGRRIDQRVAADHGAVLVADATNPSFVDTVRRSYPEFVAVAGALGIKSLILVPLWVAARPLGLLTLYGATRRFGSDDLERAEELAPHLVEALENARLHKRLQTALQVREDFIVVAGHELRTPLTVLRLTAEQLARRAPNDVVVRSAQNMVQQTKRLERLSSQMLDAASIAASGRRFPSCPAPTDLATVVREAAEAFAPVLERGGCTLVLRADEPVVGEWDAVQLDAMVTSLLDNAAKFGAGQPVEVDVRRENDAATLSVSDHGQGIPPAEVGAIFEEFKRAVPASHYGGLGLGLYIARAIAEAHGGDLSVDNHPGQGATFTAHLPLRPQTVSPTATTA
jgi:signal transduction histidine kinase